MIQDVLIPSKIGSYYIFSKRILGFEITTHSVQASLIYFSKKNITIENSMSIVLTDSHPMHVSNAIKKIATTIGSYDEIVTCLSSSAIIYKELTLPFVGREKIDMIIRYEVEPLLPFTLDQAVIDFLITQEDTEKNQSTVLVAATRKVDFDNYIDYFEQAGIVLTNVSIDMFVMYDFYRQNMYVAQAQTSLLLVDFSLDAIRIVYIQKGVLTSVRLVPYGIIGLIKKMNETLENFNYSSLESLFENQETHYHDQLSQDAINLITQEFAKQILLSISFFQKQIKNFTSPLKIICFGAGAHVPGFVDTLPQLSQYSVEVLDMQKIIARNNMTMSRKIKVDVQNSLALLTPLSVAQYGQVNLLFACKQNMARTLWTNQLIVLISCTILIFTSIYFYTHYQLERWNIDYEKSKKQMVNIIHDHMDVSIKNSKRVSDIVAAADEKLQQTKKVCLSFDQTHHNNYLHHLHELCTAIDRNSLGLNLQKMSFSEKEVSLQGKIEFVASDQTGWDAKKTAWDNLDIFTQTLINLPGFTLKNIPAELSFNVTLIMKDAQKSDKDLV
jgi:type IV pilus assembly protein PilM